MLLVNIMKENKNRKKDKKVKDDNFLYRTVTKITISEFKKYQKFYLNKYKSSLIPKIIMVILSVLAIGLNYLKGNYNVVFLVIGFVILYPVFLTITLNRQIVKMYSSNKRINELDETISFYEKYLESKSSHNYCKVSYDDLYKVCETKTNFYIFVKDNQAFIIIKDMLDDVDSFREFIKDKAEYRKYR